MAARNFQQKLLADLLLLYLSTQYYFLTLCCINFAALKPDLKIRNDFLRIFLTSK
jgi:hypothetical protein